MFEMFEYVGNGWGWMLGVLFWAMAGIVAFTLFVFLLYGAGRAVSAGWHVSKVKLIRKILIKEVDRDR